MEWTAVNNVWLTSLKTGLPSITISLLCLKWTDLKHSGELPSTGRPYPSFHKATTAQDNCGPCPSPWHISVFSMRTLSSMGRPGYKSGLYTCIWVTCSAIKSVQGISVLMTPFTPPCNAMKQAGHPWCQRCTACQWRARSRTEVSRFQVSFYFHLDTTATGWEN